MMPKPTDREKKIWLTADIQTLGWVRALQSGVKIASSPVSAPGRVREIATMRAKADTSRGMKTAESSPMPLSTPEAMIAMTTIQTMMRGMATPGTKSKLSVFGLATWTKVSMKKRSGLLPQLWSREKPTYRAAQARMTA